MLQVRVLLSQPKLDTSKEQYRGMVSRSIKSKELARHVSLLTKNLAAQRSDLKAVCVSRVILNLDTRKEEYANYSE